MNIKKIKPYALIVTTFISAILLGALLLLLPFSTKGNDLSFIDALFTSTSAVCVTGLATVNIAATFTHFGRIVMIILMEIGGLSFLTIAVFFFSILGARLSVSNSIVLKEALNQKSLNGIIPLVKKIVIISLCVQLIGILINLIVFVPYSNGNFLQALEYSVFHSVASFNNAGFDIFGEESMIGFSGNILLNLNTMYLIIVGGIGFVVISDLAEKKRWSKLSLHTKITLIATFFLVVIGTLLLKLTMSNSTWLESMFTSVTTRTAGFTTVDMSTLTTSPAAYMVVITLMVIGASPCSTGGGVKTTTFAIILIATYYFAKGKKAKAFERRIVSSEISKAFILVSVAIGVIVMGTFLVSAIQPEFGIERTLFEVVSAFSTTGLSMGITGSLCVANKIIVIILMFVGRLGPLTIIGLINKNYSDSSFESLKYVEESVIIG